MIEKHTNRQTNIQINRGWTDRKNIIVANYFRRQPLKYLPKLLTSVTELIKYVTDERERTKTNVLWQTVKCSEATS